MAYNGAGQVSVQELDGGLPTFRAEFANIFNTVVIGTTMGFAALWHTSSSTKTLRLLRVYVTLKSNSTLSNLTLKVQRTNATVPAGGTAITPAPNDPRDTVDTNTVVQTNNADLWTVGTTPAYVAQSAHAQAYWRQAAYTTGVGGTGQPWMRDVITVYDYQPGRHKPLVLRPGVTEGVVLSFDVDANTGITIGGGFEWTEE